MFPLKSQEFPSSRDALREALQESLQELFTLPSGAPTVALEGDCYPELRALGIDLTGATLDPARRPPKPAGTGQRSPGIRSARFAVTAHPLHCRGVLLHLDLKGRDGRFDFDRDAAGRPFLVLTRAKDGSAVLKLAREDLESLLLSGARSAAAPHGLTVEDMDLKLSSLGARSVSVALRVRARKGFFGTTLHINGRLQIDDTLNATASGLECTGDGVIGTLACGFITPHLQRFEGRPLPLMAFALGEVRLRDVSLRAGDSLEVTATFGS